MEKLKYLVRSRKFWAAVGGVLVVVVKAFKPDFPLSDEQILGVVAVLSSYIIGTGLDSAKPGS